MSKNTRDVEKSLPKTIDFLAASYTKVIMYHDLGDYAALGKSSESLLEVLNVPKEKTGQASGIVSLMYKESDDADTQLGLGNRKNHDHLFGKIFELAEELDTLLELSDCSVRDEVRWWYHYRLSRSKVGGKKSNKPSRFFHFAVALFFIYIEHLRRIKAPLKAMICTYWLAKAGRKHERDDWAQAEFMLRRYWSAKISGNSGKVEPKLILV